MICIELFLRTNKLSIFTFYEADNGSLESMT